MPQTGASATTHISTNLFMCSLVFFIIAFILEYCIPGFISDIISIKNIILTSIISGILFVLQQRQRPEQLSLLTKEKRTFLAAAFAITIVILLITKLNKLGITGVALALMCGATALCLGSTRSHHSQEADNKLHV